MKTKILKVNPESPEPERIAEAARFVKEGRLAAFPTDTVYGLGADVFNQEAVEKVFKVKRRSRDKPISLLAADFAGIEPLVEEIPPQALVLADYFWPGALTIVFKANGKVSPLLIANSDKIGMRIPDNIIALALIKAVGFPITGSSANLSGQPELCEAEGVEKVLGGSIELILDGGKVRFGFPSTVVDVSSGCPRILRQGIITRARIEEVLGGRIDG